MGLPSGYGIFMTLFVIVLVAFFSLAAFSIRYSRKHPGGPFKVLAKSSIFLCTAFLTLFVLEIYFLAFMDVSDGFNFTLAGKKWLARHWHPINKMGFRDQEFGNEELAKKKIALALGDSFVAGHGIKKVKDRFADRIGSWMGEEWRVLNVAQNGWSTADQVSILKRFAIKPDLILWSWFINDIESAALQHDRLASLGKVMPTGLGGYLVKKSFLINYLYWRTFRSLAPVTNKYFDRLPDLFFDEEVWKTHSREMQQIIDYARNNKIPIMVLVIPNLGNVEGTRPVTAKVAAFLSAQQVPFIDLAPHLSGRDVSGLIVSKMDLHPNETLHAEIAEIIKPVLEPLLKIENEKSEMNNLNESH